VWAPFPSVEDCESAAILVNRSKKAIVDIDFQWMVSMRGERRNWSVSSSGARLLDLFVTSVFYPENWALQRYLAVILPGSKRLVLSGELVGDNTDVELPPRRDKPGGWFSVSHGAHRTPPEGARSLTLTLDGIFFEDGEFSGPNRLGAWERVSIRFEVWREVARIARSAHDRGIGSSAALAEIEAYTGAFTDRPQLHLLARGNPKEQRIVFKSLVAARVQNWRRVRSDEEIVLQFSALHDAPWPRLRRA
jgi:hypothetical protein